MPLTLHLREEHYPFWVGQIADFAVHRVELFASAGDGNLTVYDAETDEPPGSRQVCTLTADATVGGLRAGTLTGPRAAVGEFNLYFEDNSISDLWIALIWGGGVSS